MQSNDLEKWLSNAAIKSGLHNFLDSQADCFSDEQLLELYNEFKDLIDDILEADVYVGTFDHILIPTRVRDALNICAYELLERLEK
jgi:hypothetical protein